MASSEAGEGQTSFRNPPSSFDTLRKLGVFDFVPQLEVSGKEGTERDLGVAEKEAAERALGVERKGVLGGPAGVLGCGCFLVAKEC
jgi:hypothetical protein